MKFMCGVNTAERLSSWCGLLFLFGLVMAGGANPVSSSAQEEGGNMEEKKKDPFMLPLGVYPKGMEPKENPEILSLEAVVTFQGRKQAVINGNNYSAGDYVFGQRIVEIFTNRVRLEEKGKMKDLMLKSLQPNSQRFFLRVRPHG